MKKILLCIGVLITPFLGFNTHPEDLSENNAQIVALLGDQLTKHPEWLDEINRKMENFDLSGREIGPVDFNGWSLVNIDFSNTDLSETQLYKAKSEGVKLGGAILCKGVRLGKNISDSRLVKLYSRFIKDGEMEKAEALNNIIGFLNVSLKGKDVSDLDITGIYVNFDLSPQLVDQSSQNVGLSSKTNSSSNLDAAAHNHIVAAPILQNAGSSSRTNLLSNSNTVRNAVKLSNTNLPRAVPNHIAIEVRPDISTKVAQSCRECCINCFDCSEEYKTCYKCCMRCGKCCMRCGKYSTKCGKACAKSYWSLMKRSPKFTLITTGLAIGIPTLIYYTTGNIGATVGTSVGCPFSLLILLPWRSACIETDDWCCDM